MRISKALVTAAVGAATVLALSGCASGSPTAPSANPDEKATITFLTFQSPNLTKEFWEEQVSAIKKQYPNLTVEIQYSPGLDRQGYAKQLLATGNLPDVIWDVPLQDFARAGAILPYDESQLTGIDVPADAGLVDGKRYSLTVGAQAIPLVYYNKSIFEAQGISVPETYDELIDAAEALKAANITPFLVGGGADTFTSTMLLDGIITADVYGQDPDWNSKLMAGEVTFEDPLFKSAVEKWANLIKDGLINSDALTVDYTQLQAKFAKGEAAMYPMGSWAGATVADFEVGVFPLPTDAGDTVLGVNYGQALAVSSTTKYPAQAQAFAVALATSAATATAQLNADALIPVIKGFEIPSDSAPLIAATVEAYMTPDAVRVLPFGWEQGDGALPSGFTDEFNRAAQKVIGGGSVDDFLAEITKDFSDLNQG